MLLHMWTIRACSCAFANSPRWWRDVCGGRLGDKLDVRWLRCELGACPLVVSGRVKEIGL